MPSVSPKVTDTKSQDTEPGWKEQRGEQRASGEGLGPSLPAGCLGRRPEGVLLAGAGPKGLERLETWHRKRSWHPSSNSLQGARPASHFPRERAPRLSPQMSLHFPF